MDAHELTVRIKEKALELGYVRVGVTTPDPFPAYEDEIMRREGYDFWTAQGRDSELVSAARPREHIPGVKSLISLVFSYGNIDFPEKLLAYAGRAYLGRCYGPQPDTVNGQRLVLFCEFLRSLGVGVLKDGSTLQQTVDRAVGARAGVITYGKNNFAYAGEYGSFIILTTVPVDTELEMEVHEPKRTCPPYCRRCIDACPTHAMDDDGALNPLRCVLMNNLSPNEVRDVDVVDALGTRVHGCDECQLACPRNKKALEQTKVKDPLLERLVADFTLEDLLFCDEDYYVRNVRPIMYNYIRDIDLFRRNAATAMGNSGDARYVDVLRRAVETGSESVREEAMRAIEKLEHSK